nr:IS200/IS605 family transposase [Candidatus Sigynarchaeota archaeon]
MSDFITYNGSICNINYHFVWVTKYRKQVLTFPDDVKAILQAICDENGWTIRSVEVMPDHVHLFITTPPFIAPSVIAKIVKGSLARKIFIAHPEITSELWGGHLWSSSYYCGTAGTVTAETVRRYIENQRQRGGVSSHD